MTFNNRLTQMLDIQHPVILAPMDLVSGGRLAASVSHAGGLGLLGGGYGRRDWIDREWDRAGNARIGCGFITWSLAQHPEALDHALAHQPAAIMLSFGDPRPFSSAIHRAGARLICQVQTVEQAREALEAGADVIVAQGTEAGGHGMSQPLFTLLPGAVALMSRPRRGGGAAGCRRQPTRSRHGGRDAARRRWRLDGHALLRLARRRTATRRPNEGLWKRKADRPRGPPFSICRGKSAGRRNLPGASCATGTPRRGSAAKTNWPDG